jgi:NADPH:quinone reductase-like Zn-dependent oxidoreductase
MARRGPEKLSYEEAAAIPEAFLTAYLNLFTLGGLHGHDSVLIHAGGSGMGTAAIQLASAEGAYIFTTAGSADKLERCKELGAEVLINYKTDSFLERVRSVTDGRGVDIILDFIGAPYWNDNLDALADHGRLMLIGFLGGAAGELSLSAIMSKNLTISGTLLRRTPLPQKIELTAAFVNYGFPLLESGEIKPVIDRIFPLEQANEAHRYMQNNSNFGKIVLTIAD